MNIGSKMRKQKDGLYEVIFDDGSKKAGLSLMEAASIIDKCLSQDNENTQATTDSSGDNPG